MVVEMLFAFGMTLELRDRTEFCGGRADDHNTVIQSVSRSYIAVVVVTVNRNLGR